MTVLVTGGALGAPMGGAMSRLRWLDPVRTELDRLERPKDVFFRDDDADLQDDRLDQLLRVFSSHGLTCDVGLTPARLTPALVCFLTGWALVDGIRLHQHGWSQPLSNGRREGRGVGRTSTCPRESAGVAGGRSALRRELGGLLDDVFTAPRGHCSRELGELLVTLGIHTLSPDPTAAPLHLAGLTEVSVTVDWSVRPTGDRRTHETLGRRIAAAVARPEPLGIRLDHAASGPDDLLAVDQLLGLLVAHPNAAPSSLTRLGGRY